MKLLPEYRGYSLTWNKRGELIILDPQDRTVGVIPDTIHLDDVGAFLRAWVDRQGEGSAKIGFSYSQPKNGFFTSRKRKGDSYTTSIDNIITGKSNWTMPADEIGSLDPDEIKNADQWLRNSLQFSGKIGHQERKNFFAHWRNLRRSGLNYLEEETPITINAVQQLSARYPVSEGWVLQPQVRVSDDQSFFSNIDVLAYNKRTKQSDIIRVGTGEPTIADTAILSAQRRFYIHQDPHNQAPINTLSFNLSSGAFKNVTPFESKRMARLLYGTVVWSPQQIEEQRPLTGPGEHHFFRQALSTSGDKFVFLDIETVGTTGSILSVGAIKMRLNPVTEEFETIATHNRYYFPRKKEIGTKDWYESLTVHGLDVPTIKQRRKDSPIKYHKKWDEQELTSLLSFIEGFPVAGHNIAQFDIPRLFGRQQMSKDIATFFPGGIIDTYHLAQATRGEGAGINTLDTLIALTYGKSMEELLGQHHDSSFDAQAVAALMQAWRKRDSRLGAATRYVMGSKGRSTRWRDRMLEGDQFIMSEVLGMNFEDLPEDEKAAQIADVILNIKNGDPDANIWDYLDEDAARKMLDKAPTRMPAGPSNWGGSAEDLQKLTGAIMSLANIVPKNTTISEWNENLALQNRGAAQSFWTQAARIMDPALRKEFIHNRYPAGSPLAQMVEKQAAILASEQVRDTSLSNIAAAISMKGPREPYSVENVRRSWYSREMPLRYNDNAYKWALPRPVEGISDYGFRSGHIAYWDSTTKKQRFTDIGEFYGYQHLEGVKEGPKRGYDWNKLFEAFKRGLDSATKALNTAAPIFMAVGSITKEMSHAALQQGQDIFDAVNYFVPMPLRGATSRLYTAMAREFGSQSDRFSYRATAIGQGLAGAGGIVGGILTANPILVGGGIANLIQGYGSWKTGNIKTTGQHISSQINLWSGFSELLLAPIRLAGNTLRWLIGHLRVFGVSLGNLISKFNELGLPLTMVSGMSYADMQRSYVRDAMIGAKYGTMESGAQAFSYAQQDLYTFGQLDTNRLIASAMLGVFGDVYGIGGDPKKQYANVLNTAYQRIKQNPWEEERVMNLLRVINPAMPASLQQMKNLSQYNSVYENYDYIGSTQWQRDRGLNIFTADEMQRAKFTVAGMEYTALSTSIGNTVNVITEKMWSSYGKPLMSGFNDIFARLVTDKNFTWRDALSAGWGTVQGVWSNIKKDFDIPDISTIATKLVHATVNAFASMIEIVGTGWGEIGRITVNSLENIVSDLSLVSVDIDWSELLAGHIGKAFKLNTPEAFATEWNATHKDWSIQPYRNNIETIYNALGDEEAWRIHMYGLDDKVFGNYADVVNTIKAFVMARDFTGSKDFVEMQKNPEAQRFLQKLGVLPYSSEASPLHGIGEQIYRTSSSLGKTMADSLRQHGENFILNIGINGKEAFSKTFSELKELGGTTLNDFGYDITVGTVRRISAGREVE